MKLNLRITFTALIVCSAISTRELPAQTTVPIRTLSKPEAVTVLPFGAIESVRPLNGNRVLVNDNRKRQIIALDSTFDAFTIVLDSAESAGLFYGASTAPLIAYPGDSTLFRDATTNKFLVIDPNGEVAHRLENTKPGQTVMALLAVRGFDAFGNAIMPALPQIGPGMLTRGLTDAVEIPIVRANFSTRLYDQLTKIHTMSAERTSLTTANDGTRIASRMINPFPISDDWAVLSDGTLAVVRAEDYRVDIIDPNGMNKRSLKIPYDKRRLTNDDKLAIIDSARAALTADQDPNSESNRALGMMTGLMSLYRDSIRKVARPSDGAFKVTGTPVPMPSPPLEFIPVKDMPDFLPPFRKDGLRADLDANLWILTNGALAVNSMESVYDVVNNQARLVQHVRVPAGRTIAGFGRNGVVYLKYKTDDGVWKLERTRLVQ